MMSNTFLIGCTHFGHENFYTKFKDEAGNPARPQWKSAEEADEAMIALWNATVKPNDKVYHLGDVAVPRKALQIMSRLNGRKILIKGNHDIFKLADYAAHFSDIRAIHKLDKFYLTHVPLHPESVPDWCDCNVHAHTHRYRVLDAAGVLDTRYFSVSVEHIEYAPIEFGMLRHRISTEKASGWQFCAAT